MGFAPSNENCSRRLGGGSHADYNEHGIGSTATLTFCASDILDVAGLAT